MINNTNKNVSVWRGDKTPPTEYHVWIKSDGSVLINKDGTWFTQISESTNDSVNVCNLSDSRHLTLEEALDIVAQYLGADVFHAGYKIRFNVTPNIHTPNVWKEYIFTAPTLGNILYKQTQFWKLLATSDLFDSNGEIRSQYLPSYVDDVLEFESIDLFPEEGESDKIYVDTSTNKSYRWSGTQYVLIALTDIVTQDTMGLMSPQMYQKLEKTASDLDIHDRQNQVDFAEIREALGKKVGKIVDSQGNVISEDTHVATIPDGTDKNRGLMTPTVYNLVDYLDNHKVEKIKDSYGNYLPKVGTIVTIPNATTQKAGLMTPADKEILDKIQPEFVKDLGLVASTDEGDQMAAKSEIAGNVKISFIRYRTAGVRAERVTTIFQWRNGINETAQIKFVDKAQWRRNVTGATGVAGATTTPTMWERTGAHYLYYNAASRTLQLADYNKTVFREVQLPLAQKDADVAIDGLISSEDIASIITKADFDRWTGEIHLKNKENNQVTYLVIPPATKDGMGLMSQNDVIEMGTLTEHRLDRNNPHNVTKAQVGLGNVTNDAQVKRSEMGQPDGVALLNSDGKIPSSYLPSYVSDIITANSYSTLPTTGEEDKIYVTKDTNLTYRWSGTSYVEISPSIALGETSTTAYAGDKGKSLANSVIDLESRVGHGYVNTETGGFAYIGTGDTKVKIIPGAQILASVVGQGTNFTISSNTDTVSIGYGASIGQNSVLGKGFNASIGDVLMPNGFTKQGIVLGSIGGNHCIRILGKDNGEFLMSTSLFNHNWIDLARLGKISTMIESTTDGLVFYPNRLIGNSKDTSIILGTRTTIGENVHIGSNVEIGGGISLRDDGTGYILLGDGTTKIKKGVTIDGNSGSSEQRVHEYQGSWLIGENLTPNETTATLGKGVILVGTTATNRPMLIRAGGATALIGANFNAYSGVTLGSYSSLGNQAKLGDNVEIIQGASGLTIVSNDYGMTIGTKVSIGNNVSLGNNVIISEDVSISTNVSVSDMGDEVSVGDVTISTGISITKNAATTTIQNNNESSSKGGKLTFGTDNIIWDGVEIGTGVHITEDLTFDSTSYKLGGTNQTTIGKNLNISGNVDRVDVLLKPSEGEAGKIRIQDTVGNNNWLTLEGKNNILGGDFYGGYMSTIWSGVEIGTGVILGTSLRVDQNNGSPCYKIGDSATVSTIGANVKLMASLSTSQLTGGTKYYQLKDRSMSIAAIGENVKLLASLGTISNNSKSYYELSDPNVDGSTIRGGVELAASLGITNNGYTLDDPSMNISISTIGKAVRIYSEVEIGTGIQIQESPAGGLQIYLPSQGRWITIN